MITLRLVVEKRVYDPEVQYAFFSFSITNKKKEKVNAEKKMRHGQM